MSGGAANGNLQCRMLKSRATQHRPLVVVIVSDERRHRGMTPSVWALNRMSRL